MTLALARLGMQNAAIVEDGARILRIMQLTMVSCGRLLRTIYLSSCGLSAGSSDALLCYQRSGPFGLVRESYLLVLLTRASFGKRPTCLWKSTLGHALRLRLCSFEIIIDKPLLHLAGEVSREHWWA